MSNTVTIRNTVVVWLATLATALSFRAVLADTSWLVPLVTLVTLSFGVGLAVQLVVRRYFPAFIAQVVTALCAATYLLAPSTAVAGIVPSLRTFTTLGQQLSAGMQEMFAGTQVKSGAPVPVTAETITAVCLLTIIVAVLALTFAVGATRPLAAAVPILALYALPLMANPSRTEWTYFVLAALGFLLLLISDATLRNQEHVDTQLTNNQGTRVMAIIGFGLAALVVGAVAIAPIPTPKSVFQKDQGDITIVNPITRIREKLTAPPNVIALTYTTSAPQGQYIRIAADEVFTGNSWMPTVGSIDRDLKANGDWPAPPGLSSSVPTTRATTTISLNKITTANEGETYLPLPYPTQKVEIPGNGWIIESSSLNVISDGLPTQNITYTAEHLLVPNDADQLKNAGTPASTIKAEFTKLPNGMPATISRTATTVAGSGNAYEQAKKLENYFAASGKFTYDRNPSGSNVRDSGQNAISDFLEGRRGYCVQFASTMAVMARSLGIPARIAVGFKPGTAQGGGTYEVRLRDAHAWPELYFEGTGWVSFEPTPGVAAEIKKSEQAAQPEPSPSQAEASQSSEPSASESSQPSSEASAPTATPPSSESLAKDEQDRSAPWWQEVRFILLSLVLVGALGGLVFFSPPLVAKRRRARRWKQAHYSGQSAPAGWHELQSRLSDLGIQWSRSWTPRSTQSRLSSDYQLSPDAQDALLRLTSDVETASYGAPGYAQHRPVAQVLHDVQLVTDQISQQTSRAATTQAQWWPRSGYIWQRHPESMPLPQVTPLAATTQPDAADSGPRIC